MNRKGSADDVFFILIGLFSLAVVVIFLYYFLYTSDEQFQAINESIMPVQAKSVSTQITGWFPSLIDGLIFFLFIGLCIGMVILASLVPMHPVFIIFYLIVYAFAVVFAGFISNMYEYMTQDNPISTIASNMVMTGIIFKYLPWFIGIVGAVLAVVMYKVSRGQNEAV